MRHRVKMSNYVTWWTVDDKDYIYCTRSGLIARIDEQTKHTLKSIQYLDEITDEFQRQFFVEKGILVSEDVDEFGLFRFYTMSEQFNSSPTNLSFTIAVTEQCNYHCSYCFESKTMNGNRMSDETVDAIIAYIKGEIDTSQRLEELKITWFGGEPLLELKIIEKISTKIIQYCAEKGIKYIAAIITNGSLASESAIALLEQLNVSFIQITLDGDFEETCKLKGCTKDLFLRSLQGVLFAAKKMRINVRLNTDGSNIDSIISVVKTIRDQAIQENVLDNIRFYLACIEKAGDCLMPDWFVEANKKFLDYLVSNGMKEDILVALPKARYSSCGAVTNSHFFIGTDGSIVKCEHYLGRTDKKVGTVFSGLWHNRNEAEFRDITVQPRCESCSFFPICRQGCLARRLDEKNEMNCNMFITNIQNIIESFVVAAK